ncbi:hypothetical protein WJX77_006242 [Trebouxia sp. C0004]
MERCRYTEAFLQIYMASQELRAFLSRVDSRYVDHADAIHQGEVTNQAELAAADRTDLEKLGIPKGAAGLIIAAAGGKGRLAEALIEEGPGPSKKSKTGPSSQMLLLPGRIPLYSEITRENSIVAMEGTQYLSRSTDLRSTREGKRLPLL